MKKKKIGKLGIRMAYLMISCVLLLMIGLAIFSYFSFRKSFRYYCSNKAQSVAQIMTDVVDGDKIGKYVETLETDEYYAELEQLFSEMKEDSKAARVYIFYPKEDQFVYILDACTSQDDKNRISHLGDIYEYGETEYTYLLPDVQTEKPSTEIIVRKDVDYGISVSAWAPVFDSQGNVVAMIEVDYYLTEIRRNLMSYVVIFGLVILAGTGAILLLLLYFNNRFLTKPLGDITDVIASYKDGEFDLKNREVRTGDEIQQVYETFVQMVDKIDVHVEKLTKITAEKERIGAELDVATQIQADMLPNTFPAFPDKKEIDIYALMQPAREVGGDFYDFFWVDETHLAFVIADVSGKGVPAALFMVIAKTIIKNNAMMGLSVEKIFEAVNNQLCEGNVEAFFVTSWLGMLDVETGKVEFVNAGHNIPLLMTESGVEWVHSEPDLVLAAMEDMLYTKVELQMQPGNRLLLYTDGVIESVNVKLEAYGEDRLKQLYEETKECTPKEAVDVIKHQVEIFAGEAEQFDDITLLIMEYKGK